MAEGEDLSNLMSTYPQFDMYSDVIDFENMLITFYLDIGFDENWETYDACYLTAVLDMDTGMPMGFEVTTQEEETC